MRLRALAFTVVSALVFVLALVLAPRPARAFCGFYVNTGQGPAFNDASRAVLMRVGMRTVLSIQNEYHGPLDDFALVVPVPVVLEKKNVRTLSEGLFDRVDRLSAPRLVEYWEQDPCAQDNDADRKEGGGGATGTRAKPEDGAIGVLPKVKVEAEFKVEEYDVVVLSASDSGALEKWLRDNRYVLPAGAEPLFRPYVEDGSKFFVARVDVKRVKFRWGKAVLSPLRFFYDTPAFSLPTRLGLINSAGVQDLLVYILAAQRYETANYDNLTIPTNLPVRRRVKGDFNAFYAALYDQTVKGHPRAVVTEYAWMPSSCDPCPSGSGPLESSDLADLGGDVIPELPSSFVLTRLHARYTKETGGEDLVFRAASPIVGGREEPAADGTLRRTAIPDHQNAFQARYIIRHPWAQPLTCQNPIHGVWGANPDPSGTKAGEAWAGAPGGRRDLDIVGAVASPEEERSLRQGSGATTSSGFALRMIGKVAFSREGGPLVLELIGGATFLVLIAGWRRHRRLSRGIIAALLFLTLVAVGAILASLVEPTGTLAHTIKRNLGRTLAYVLAMTSLIVGAALVAIGGGEPRRPGLIRVLAALLPAVAVYLDTRRVTLEAAASLSDPAPEVDVRARIAASLFAETAAPIAAATLWSGMLLLVLAVRAARATAPGERGARLSPALVVGGAALFGGLGRILVRDHVRPLDAVAFVGFVVAAGVVDRVLRSGRIAGGAPIFASAAAGALLFDVGTRLGYVGHTVDWVSRDSIEPHQWPLFLVEAAHEDHVRILLFLVDALLLSAVVVLRARENPPPPAGASPELAPRPILEAMTCLVIGGLLVASLTALDWTGRNASIRDIGRDVAHLAWRSGAPPVLPIAPGAVVAPDLRAPAIVVDRGQLFVSAGPGTTPVPYEPRLLEGMAKAAADSSGPTLLSTSGSLSFQSLVEALGPILSMKQSEYALVVDVALLDPALGKYAAIVTSLSIEPHPLEILPEVVVFDQRPSKDALPVAGFVLSEGRSALRMISLAREPGGWAPGRASLSGELPIGTSGNEEAIVGAVRAAETSTALLAVAPETTLAEVHRAIGAIGRLRQTTGYRMSTPVKLFSKILVAPARRSVEEPRKAP